jgi:hypothetical protein
MSVSRSLRVLGVLLATVAVPVPLVPAQTTGTLAGVVTDGAGARLPVPATVVVVNAVGATRQTETESDGSFSFSQMRLGRYTITVSAEGFLPREVTAQVRLGATSTVPIRLQPVPVTTAAVRRPAGPAAVPLVKGEIRERTLVGGSTHFYAIEMDSNQYVALTVDDPGTAIVIRVFDPKRERLTEPEAIRGSGTRRKLSFIAHEAGTYVVEIRSLAPDDTMSQYGITLAARRRGSDRDRLEVDLRRAFARAEQLAAQRTAEGMRSALGEYERALDLARSTSDTEAWAVTCERLARTYEALGDAANAAKYRQRAGSPEGAAPR